MKKLIWLWLFIVIILSGCASINAHIAAIERLERFKEITVDVPYPEAFRATITVFQDLDIKIIKKDYENKKIFALFQPSPPVYYQRYGIYFEEKGNETKIISKAWGRFAKNEFILNKIQEEIELQRKF